MRTAPWKTLAADLRDRRHHDPYLDRLRRRVDPEQAHEQLERELIHEMAAALGRAERKVIRALAALERAAEALAAARDARDRASRKLAFDQRRAAALAARHELLIHREAVGLRRNDMLESLYPVPPAPDSAR